MVTADLFFLQGSTACYCVTCKIPGTDLVTINAVVEVGVVTDPNLLHQDPAR